MSSFMFRVHFGAFVVLAYSGMVIGTQAQAEATSADDWLHLSEATHSKVAGGDHRRCKACSEPLFIGAL